MKYLMIVGVILLGMSSGLRAQTTIVQWTFDGATSSDVPGSVTSPAAVVGTGTAQLTGGVTATFGGGSGSSDPVSPATSNFSWQTTGYPAPGAASSTAGIILSTSTKGFHSVALVFDQRLSSTSNDTWIVYFTTDITAANPVWTQAKVFTFTPQTSGTGDTWYDQRTVDLSSYTSANDDPNFAVKIVSAFDPTTGDYLASASNKTYVTTGNSRFDMIAISGIADVIAFNTQPTATVSVAGNLNVGDTLRGTYVYSDAEGDLENYTLLAWFRADDASGTNADSIETNNTAQYVLMQEDLGKFILFQAEPFAKTGTIVGQESRTAWQGPVQQSQDVLLYPAPFDLSKGNYAFKNWPAISAVGTFPPSMVFQEFATEPASPGTAPTALWECTYNNTSHSRMLGLDDGGVAFLNTSDVQTADQCGNGTNSGGYVGAAVVSLNTTGVTNITVSWSQSLVVAGNGTPSREYHIRPQYRVFGGSSWTDFGDAYEFSSATATPGKIVAYSVTLPAALENIPNVFVRWVYYQVNTGASGSRPEISLDDITVRTPDAPNSAPIASSVSVAGLITVNQSLTGTYVYSDAEGDVEGVSLKQWLRADDASGTNAAPIASATALTYTTTSADIGKYIAFGVQPVAVTGTLQGIQAVSAYAGPFLNLGDPSVVKINEVYSTGDLDPVVLADWIEFYNPGATDVTLANLQLCDSKSCEALPNAPAALTVPAHGFLAISQNKPNSFTFGLSSAGEDVVLKNPFKKTVIDSLSFPAMVVGESFGRYTDGTTRLTILIPPTFGATNNTAKPQDIVTGLGAEHVVSVYPNPAKNYIMVEGPSENPIQLISLRNLTGQEVMRAMVTEPHVQLPVADMKGGFYLLYLTHQNGAKEIVKIVKE